MIFLDANILVEILLKRPKSQVILDLLLPGGDFYISILTVHLVYHFGLKSNFSLQSLDVFLMDFKVLNSGQEVYELAKKIRLDGDFEDSLQVATALYNELECIYTLDKNLAKRYGKLAKIELL